MGIPTLELHPGAGLGPFTLGSPLCAALAAVEQQQWLFESTVVKYSEQDPMLWDIVVAFPHLGLHLCFHPQHQRLHKLEVYDVSRVHLRYANSIIGGPSTPATFARIYSVLGPTFPGAYSPEAGTYTLSYPGLSLLFRIPPRYSSCCLHCKELPMEFPDGTTPVVARITLHPEDSPPAPPGMGAPPRALPLPPLPLPGGGEYMERVLVRLGRALLFEGGGQEVCFGDSPQDVWSELGRPSSISHRETETMLIHLPVLPVLRPGQAWPTQQGHAPVAGTEPGPGSGPGSGAGAWTVEGAGAGVELHLPSLQGLHLQQSLPQSQQQHQQQQQQQEVAPGTAAAAAAAAASPGDCVWSYFSRGIDVVFDAEGQAVKKFVLHTNAPGHPDFNEYVKCNFAIPAQDTDEGAGQTSTAGDRPREAITPDSKWQDVQRVMGCGSRAAIQTSGSLFIAFGATFVYGLPGATFEVLRNGHVSKVTLF